MKKLPEIDLSKMKRNDVVPIYVDLIKNIGLCDGVAEFNQKIIARWSIPGLNYIKEKAWKRLEFKSTHNLKFLSRYWDSPFNFGGYYQFKIGTCSGAWISTDNSYDILAIENNQKGNGHFEDVLEWFENSCKRDGKDFRILEVWNRNLARHLVRGRGFEAVEGTDHYIKRCNKS